MKAGIITILAMVSKFASVNPTGTVFLEEGKGKEHWPGNDNILPFRTVKAIQNNPAHGRIIRFQEWQQMFLGLTGGSG